MSNEETIAVIKNDRRYLRFLFLIFYYIKLSLIQLSKKVLKFQLVEILEKNRLIHLLEPLTSTPIRGTKNKNNEIMKKISENFIK